MINLSIFLLINVFFFYGLYAKPLHKQRIRRNAFRDESRLWPKGVVPYTLDEAFSKHQRSIIEKATRDIEGVSCIRFKKHSTEKAFVEIVHGKECSASVGYYGRRSTLTLEDECFRVPLVLHELLHVLGFFHEHKRPDRDDFVSIYEDNIKADEIYNFFKMSESDVTTFGLPYDFKSVMHYQGGEFAIDKSKKTMEPKVGVGNVVIGQAEELSKMDILKLNKLYQCPKKKDRKFGDEVSALIGLEDEGSGLTELEDSFIVVSMSPSRYPTRFRGDF